LTHKKCFGLKTQKENKPRPKPIGWEEHYLIWGNSELRIRFGETLMYSNFATNNGFYDNKDENVGMLLGNGSNRETEMYSYEIYQILWDKGN
jgi:hypothetical protein